MKELGSYFTDLIETSCSLHQIYVCSFTDESTERCDKLIDILNQYHLSYEIFVFENGLPDLGIDPYDKEQTIIELRKYGITETPFILIGNRCYTRDDDSIINSVVNKYMYDDGWLERTKEYIEIKRLKSDTLFYEKQLKYNMFDEDLCESLKKAKLKLKISQQDFEMKFENFIIGIILSKSRECLDDFLFHYLCTHLTRNGSTLFIDFKDENAIPKELTQTPIIHEESDDLPF